jgi:hypothetical protein
MCSVAPYLRRIRSHGPLQVAVPKKQHQRHRLEGEWVSMGTIWRLVLALLVGFAVFYVLAPTSGAGSRCYSWPFGLEVPCGIEFAMGIGAAAAVVIGVGLLWGKRRRVT